MHCRFIETIKKKIYIHKKITPDYACQTVSTLLFDFRWNRIKKKIKKNKQKIGDDHNVLDNVVESLRNCISVCSAWSDDNILVLSKG